MDEISTDILIIGGGVAGSAMCAALKDTNLNMIIVEPRAAGHLINRGDVLYPASLEILKSWKALDAIKQKGAIEFSKLGVIHNTKPLLEIDLSKFNSNFPYSLSLDHTLIEEALLNFAESNKLGGF